MLYGMRILLAEDDSLCRLIYRQQLEDNGACVTTVCDGAEAVAACAADHYDVVMLDGYMDGMESSVAAGKIRRLLPRARVILLTAPAPESAVGFDAVMEKPLDVEKLRIVMKDWC